MSTLDPATVRQLRSEDERDMTAFRACHRKRAAWDAEQDTYGDPVGYGRTTEDHRAGPTLLQRIGRLLTAKYRRALA